MGAPKVTKSEVDLSTRVPSFPGAYGAVVIPAKKGPVNEPVLITTEAELLRTFTPDETIKVGYDNSYFAALAFLGMSDKLWVVRAANTALYGGVTIATGTVPVANESLGTGDGSTVSYTGTLSNVPTLAGSVKIVAGTVTVYSDDQGKFQGSGIVKSTSVINHTTGVYTVVFSTAPANGTAITASYQQVATSGTNAVLGAGEADPATSYTFPNPSTDTILIYGANPGAWNNEIKVIVKTDYATIKERDAFQIEVYNKDNVLLETWITSRKTDKKNGYGQNIYCETLLEGSEYIRVVDNTAVDDDVLPKPQAVYLTLATGSDGSTVVDAQMVIALETLADSASYALSLVMDGGWSTVTYQLAIISFCETRQDCVGILSTPYSDEASATYMTDLPAYVKEDLNNPSSYAAIYAPHVYIYDKYNGRNVYVSPDGYAAGIIAKTAANFEIWYPPAGDRRGKINVNDLKRRFTSGQLDTLYDANINPIKYTVGKGIRIYGQKTLQTRPSATDRLNVRLLLTVIEPAIALTLEDFLFEFNDDATRAQIVALIQSYMEGIKARRGVDDFYVVCDESNNTSSDIDNHILNVWLFIKPKLAVEFITFKTIITRSGASFELAAQSV